MFILFVGESTRFTSRATPTKAKISLPFTVVTTLKLIYTAARNNDFFLGIGNGIATLYEQYTFIRFMWGISPSPSVESVFTFGNFMSLVVFACTIVGLGWMSRANYNHSRLLDAKHKAEDQQLIDDFKK